ncbi:MAG: septal ring lytic transglycosylase RlpA family protein [Patescibacteria group bacterium]
MRFQFFTISFVLPLAIAMCGKSGFDGVEAASKLPTEREFREQTIREADEAYALNPSFFSALLQWGREDDETAKFPDTIEVKKYLNLSEAKVGDTVVVRVSWYGKEFHGKKTSTGKIFDMHAASVASRVLLHGTVIRVSNPKTGKATKLTVDDRGPYKSNRELDLSYGAAIELGTVTDGVALVAVTILSIPDSTVKKKT